MLKMIRTNSEVREEVKQDCIAYKSVKQECHLENMEENQLDRLSLNFSDVKDVQKKYSLLDGTKVEYDTSHDNNSKTNEDIKPYCISNQNVKQEQCTDNIEEYHQDPLFVSNCGAEKLWVEYPFTKDLKVELHTETEEQKCEYITQHERECSVVDGGHLLTTSIYEDSGCVSKREADTVPDNGTQPGVTALRIVNEYNDSYKCDYSCKSCNEVFEAEHLLNLHSASCIGYTRFTCDMSYKTFKDKCDLRRHISNIHAEDYTYYECDLCHKMFNQKDNLIVHMKMHSGVEYYKCNICLKSYTRASSLSRHMKIHNNISYKCEICDKSYMRKISLQHHLIKCSGIKTHSDDRQFVCYVCGSSFFRKWNLKSHLLTHKDSKDYKCVTCGKLLATKYSLTQHLFVHLKPIILSCCICAQPFKKESYLKRHMTLHTSKKIFTCNICGKAYLHRGSYSYHKKKHLRFTSN